MTTASASGTRRLASWIDAFVNYTDGLPTPLMFRQWAAITTLAALLERRVWLTSARQSVFPNLYTLLVGPPGVGKSKAISTMLDVLRQTTIPGRQLHVAPDDMTSASLIDNLAKASTRLIQSEQELLEYHSLTIGASEVSVLLPQHDMQFISKLIHFYDTPDHPFEESRRGTKDHPVVIPKPQLNILGGTTPGYLGHLMPEQAWVMGFTSRLILVFAGEAPELDLFPSDPLDHGTRTKLWSDIVHDAAIIGQIYGELKWSQAAMDIVTLWYRGGLQPVPDHPKLITYNARRLIMAMKLIIVAAISSGDDLIISEDAAATGISWLLHVEQAMPEIFKDIAANQAGGAGSALNELHYYAMREFTKNGNKPLHIGRLINFLSTKVPAYQVLQLIDLAERSRLLERVAGTQDMFLPLSRIG